MGPSSTMPGPSSAQTGEPVPTGEATTSTTTTTNDTGEVPTNIPSSKSTSSRVPLVFPARLLLGQASQSGSQRPVSTGALDYVTPQGLERERLFREQIKLIEKENPIALPKGRYVKKQAPDNFTKLDFKPIGSDSKRAARLLAKARKAHNNNAAEDDILNFDSRHLSGGDWLVWAESVETRDWLSSFFLTDDFINEFRATLISDRGVLVRYTIKVSWPDSEDDNQEIVDSILFNIGHPGYIRLSDEIIKWYSDPAIQKAHVAAKKNKRNYIAPPPTPADSMYDKMFWIKVSPDVHRMFQDNWHRLRLGYGSGKLKMELAKGQDLLLSAKRTRAWDDDGGEDQRPAQSARTEAPEDHFFCLRRNGSRRVLYIEYN